MFSRLHDRIGTAGLVVAIVALIAALGGTAWAAAGLNSKQKQEVTTIAKKYAGKRGPAGPNGATGASGLAGTNGKDGTNGTPGVAGKSAVVTAIPTEVEGCEGRGGAEVKQEGSVIAAEVCNGEEGSPWTAGGNLPSKETETGSWTIHAKTREVSPGVFEELAVAPISFSLPLGTGPGAVFVFKNEASNVAAGCPGVIEGVPTADPGKLCVYTQQESGPAFEVAPGVKYVYLADLQGNPLIDGEFKPSGTTNKTGAVLNVNCGGSNQCNWSGSWAVTAP
jgi:hypothetical protein